MHPIFYIHTQRILYSFLIKYRFINWKDDNRKLRKEDEKRPLHFIIQLYTAKSGRYQGNFYVKTQGDTPF